MYWGFMMIRVLIVLYGRDLRTSDSYRSALKFFKKEQIYIYSNRSDNLVVDDGVTYWGDGKNHGLSYAYNYFIKHVKCNDDDFLIIFDDDTKFGKEYYDAVCGAVLNGNGDLFLPIVKSNSHIISPSKILNGRIAQIKTNDDVSDLSLTGINSGMMICCKIFKSIKYNEKLFLDYVDHDFMGKVNSAGYKISILNAIIEQNFSRNSTNNWKNDLFRYKIFKNDFFFFFNTHSMMGYGFIFCIKRKLELAWKHKRIVFLFS